MRMVPVTASPCVHPSHDWDGDGAAPGSKEQPRHLRQTSQGVPKHVWDGSNPEGSHSGGMHCTPSPAKLGRSRRGDQAPAIPPG